MKAAEILIHTLKKLGCDLIYIQPGSQILPITDALYEEKDKFKIIGVISESNGTIMADVSARILGRPVPIIVTAGPGATNCVTGIAVAFTANSPVIHISATLPTTSPKEAFHGVDKPEFLENIFAEVTKMSFRVEKEEELENVIVEAFKVAMRGRKAPVHIGIVDNVLASQKEVEFVDFSEMSCTDKDDSVEFFRLSLEKLLEMLTSEEPFVFYVGKGIERDKAYTQLENIVNNTNSFVVVPRHYPDSFNSYSERYCGSIGQFSNPMAIQALKNAAFVICVGIIPGSLEDLWIRKHFSKEIVYISHLETKNEHSIGIFGNISKILDKIIKNFDKKSYIESKSMISLKKKINEIRNALDKDFQKKIDEFSEKIPIYPGLVMDCLNKILDEKTIIIGDAGSAGGAWLNDCIKFVKPGQFIHSRNYDSTGFAVPAAIGVKLASPNSKVIAVTGDGSFLAGISDLPLIRMYNLDPIIIVLNDSAFGMIKQEQAERGNRFVATDLPMLNYAEVAKSMGIRGIRIEKPSQIYPAIDLALKSQTGVVIDIVTDWKSLPPSRTSWLSADH